MRTPEDLAADISGYRLEIPPTATTAELRTREDAERFFKAHPDTGGILQKLPLAKMTFPCTVTSGDPHPKTDFAKIGRMKDHIERNWTCAEIILYETLLTPGPQKEIFSGLRNVAYAYMGAAVAASVMGAQKPCGVITDFGIGEDLTINQLRGVLRKHGDIEGKLSEILRGQSETKEQLDGIKITTDETARATQVILANTSKAKTGISAGKASKIWKILSPADAPTDDTIRNWIKQGHLPKHPNVQITENDLATKASFVQWLMTAFETMGRGRLTPTKSQQKWLNDV